MSASAVSAPIAARRRRATRSTRLARVDIVIPVYNEAAALEFSVRRLHRFLQANLPYHWRIVIADNASRDATPFIARELARELPRVAVITLPLKGRGRALRAAWSASDADVVCYMDVDLSTDLRALPPLLDGLLSGEADVATGTRLASDSRVVRGRKREFISRSYNRLLRIVLRARFSDAQCGFKALRADVARRLLPEIKDQGWFFDTELLVLAQRCGLRILEVPVHWVDDPDSRVKIVRTALGDLSGVTRMLLDTRPARFVAIGIVSTIAYALLYLLLRSGLGSVGANALALALTAVANTQANRRFTFGVRGRAGLVRQHAAGAVVYFLALGLTLAALDLLHALDHRPAALLEAGVLMVASAAATLTRYVALRSWVFALRGPGSRPSSPRHGRGGGRGAGLARPLEAPGHR
jgi:glycosyltransferase involved in cell wall biosynthesis